MICLLSPLLGVGTPTLSSPSGLSGSVAHANRFLDIGILLAVVTIILNLIDFFMTAEQRKRVGKFLDDLTVLLDAPKTLDWLMRWLQATRRAAIVRRVFSGARKFIAAIIFGGVSWHYFGEAGLVGAAIMGLLPAAFWLWEWSYVAKAYTSIGMPVIALSFAI